MTNAQINAEINRLRLFAGIPSYAARIRFLEGQLSQVASVSSADFNARNNAQDKKIESKDERSIGSYENEYYVGGPLGNDENDGLTEDTPKETYVGVFNIVDASKANVIHQLGDINVTTGYGFPNKASHFDIRGVAGQDYELKFSGNGRFIFSGGGAISFENLNIINDRDDPRDTIILALTGGLQVIGCSLSATQRNIDGGGHLFNLTPFSQFNRNGTFTDPSIEGRLLTETGSFNDLSLRSLAPS